MEGQRAFVLVKEANSRNISVTRPQFLSLCLGSHVEPSFPRPAIVSLEGNIENAKANQTFS